MTVRLSAAVDDGVDTARCAFVTVSHGQAHRHTHIGRAVGVVDWRCGQEKPLVPIVFQLTPPDRSSVYTWYAVLCRSGLMHVHGCVCVCKTQLNKGWYALCAVCCVYV